jgi:hypothetical protein
MWAALVAVVAVVAVAVVIAVIAGSTTVSLDGVAGVAVRLEMLLHRGATGLLTAAPMPRGGWVLAVHRLCCSRVTRRPLM